MSKVTLCSKVCKTLGYSWHIWANRNGKLMGHFGDRTCARTNLSFFRMHRNYEHRASCDRKWLFLLPNANHTGTPPHHLLDSLSFHGLMVPYGWIGNSEQSTQSSLDFDTKHHSCRRGVWAVGFLEGLKPALARGGRSRIHSTESLTRFQIGRHTYTK
jgi:hypothetical protein